MVAQGYDYDVFINCPFDPEYHSMLDALVFAVHDCGFKARCALEIDDSGRVRIENIVELIQECRYGIHDISCTELDNANNLPRFNMPLELGLFMGATRFGSPKQRRKRALILDRQPYRYQKFISDIARQDIKSHDDDPDLAQGLSQCATLPCGPQSDPKKLPWGPQRALRGRSEALRATQRTKQR